MRRTAHMLTRHSERDRGFVIPFVALVMTVLVAFTSLAVDLGFQRVVRRDMQALADVVSLDLARRLDGRDVATLSADPSFLAARAASEARNLPELAGTGATTSFRLGMVDDAGDFLELFGPSIPSAVEVTAVGTLDWYFRPGSTSTERVAVSTQSRRAQFEVGSFLANVGSNPNSLIGQLFGNNLGANVLNPQGLVNSNIAIGQLATAIDVLRPNAAADTRLSAREFLLISAKAAELSGQTAEAALLQGAAQTALNTPTDLTVGDLTTAYLQGPGAVAGGEVNLFGYVQAAALLMNGTNVLALDQAGINLPGAAAPRLEVSVINPATMSAFGPVGIEATNQQLRARIIPNVSVGGSGNVNSCNLAGTQFSSLVGSLLNCTLGIINLLGVNVSLSSGTSALAVDGARATGRLTAIDCSTATPGITITPVAFTAAGVSATLQLTGTLQVGTQSVPVIASVPISFATAGSAPPQTFLDPSQFRQPRTVGSTTTGLAGSLTIGAIQLQAASGPALNLGPTLSGIVSGIVTTALNPVLNALDDVLSAVMTQLGANLGGAQITAHQRVCDAVSLVR